MDDIIVRAAPDDAGSRLCEDIRNQLARWVPRLLGVHVRTHSEPGPDVIALLLDATQGAAACTVLPGDAETARRELRTAALHAAAAAPVQRGADLSPARDASRQTDSCPSKLRSAGGEIIGPEHPCMWGVAAGHADAGEVVRLSGVRVRCVGRLPVECARGAMGLSVLTCRASP
ncbi:hypothetical protein [Streptomyces sp. NPDC051364]|uniref:hypothetical protein n=1 Tax=Streptomyces sp. NPDC051364 TaxID=3155799 RepID=UPI0034307995